MGSQRGWMAFAIGCACVADARAGDPPLFPVPTYPVAGVSSAQIATGDVDGDGIADLVSPRHDLLQVSRGRPDGSFGPIESHAAADADFLAALGDVDGDGDLDAVTGLDGSFGPSGVQVLLNDGDGAFTVVFSYTTGSLDVFDPLAVADVDGDGLDDIVVTNATAPAASTVTVLRATGGGGFAAPADYRLSSACRTVATGDLDLDGDIDLALPSHSQISQLVNQGDGSFVPGPVASLAEFGAELDFQLVDADGDGHLDAAYLSEISAVLSILPGLSDGSFGLPVPVALPFVAWDMQLAPLDGAAPIDLAIVGLPGLATLNGLGNLAFEVDQQLAIVDASELAVLDANIDGHADLIAFDLVGRSASVALRLDNGRFDAPSAAAVDEDLSDMAVADLDGDGLADLLEAHSQPSVVQVRLQQPDGSFALVQTLPALAGAELHPCHLDGDADVDLVVSASAGTSFAAALGQGDGTLGAFSPTIMGGRDAVLADINGDGHDDVVGWRPFAGYELLVTYGDGFGGFTGTATWSTPVGFDEIAAADIDQDGAVDLLVGAGTLSGPILKWVNSGAGSLALKSFNPNLFAPSYELACGDFNGDGDPDLLTWPGKVCMGLPGAQLAPPVALPSGATSGVPCVADVDGDGFDDLLVALSGNALSLVRGGPSGLASTVQIYACGTSVVALSVGDVDGDGRADVATADHVEWLPDTDGDFVTILLQRAPGPFADLGFALAGAEGEPALTGTGTLAGGTAMALRLTGALPLAPARLILGGSLLQLPFKGGVLVPSPTLILPPIPTDAVGKLVLGTTWPAGLPSGLSLYAQAWITDAASPAGFAATNGLRLTTP